MKNGNNKIDFHGTVWTIGHSTRPFEEFVAMLHSFQIELVADQQLKQKNFE